MQYFNRIDASKGIDVNKSVVFLTIGAFFDL